MQKVCFVQSALGCELSEMEGKVFETLHEADYSLEEVLQLLGVDLHYLQSNLLTANTQHLTTFRLQQRARHVFSEAARVYQVQLVYNFNSRSG